MNGLQYYFKPSDMFDTLPILTLYVNPIEVNRVLETGSVEEPSNKTPLESAYKYNIFGLLVKMFSRETGHIRNQPVRAKIREIVHSSAKASQLTKSINELPIDQVDKDLLTKIFMSRFKNWSNYYFKFDMDYLDTVFPVKDAKKLRNNVRDMLEKNVTIVPRLKLRGDIERLTPCDRKESYCDGRKIMIQPDLFAKLLDILCDQLMVSWRRKQIFQYGVLGDDIFDKLRFDKRLNEKIYIYPIIEE